MRVDNVTPLVHLVLERMGHKGEPSDLLIVKGTYTFEENGAPMQLAPLQVPIRRYDELTKHTQEHKLGYEVGRAHDVATYKPGTDVMVVGRARSSRAEPSAAWQVGVRVGPLRKEIRVTGPRRFVRYRGAWVLTEPTPVTEVPLDYRHAFGGHFLDPSMAPGDAEKVNAFVYHRENPAGCGWLPTAERFAKLSREVAERIQAGIESLGDIEAPQIESIRAPLRSPFDAQATDGVAPTACWWMPRLRLQGTLDEAWRRTRAPCVPGDYDPAFEQSAPQGQVAKPHLEGGEEVELSGLSPDGALKTWLPRARLHCGVREVERALVVLPLRLDTVVFDVDAGRCEMTWRVCVPRAEGYQRVFIVSEAGRDAHAL